MVSQFHSNFLGNLWGRGSCAGAVLERRRAQGGKPIAPWILESTSSSHWVLGGGQQHLLVLDY